MFFLCLDSSNALSQYNKRRQQGKGQVCTMYPHITVECLDRLLKYCNGWFHQQCYNKLVLRPNNSTAHHVTRRDHHSPPQQCSPFFFKHDMWRTFSVIGCEYIRLGSYSTHFYQSQHCGGRSVD